ncbi:MAG: hypothetical protein S4CHLAM37_07720 [Chlamydiia bacterium]|nr:hypothetical protein [Chlamydiia bacterium]
MSLDDKERPEDGENHEENKPSENPSEGENSSPQNPSENQSESSQETTPLQDSSENGSDGTKQESKDTSDQESKTEDSPPKEEKKDGIFRKEAVATHTDSLDLGPMMVVVNPKGWVGVWTIVVIAVIVFVWSVMGVIPSDVSGQGIVLTQGANFVVQAKEDGFVESIHVRAGEHIDKGEFLLSLRNSDIDLNIVESEKSLEMILSQTIDFKIHHYREIVTEREAILSSIRADELEIDRVKTEIKFLTQELCWKVELHEKGLIALPQLNNTQERLNNKKNQNDVLKSKILSSNAKLKSLDDVLQMQEFQTRQNNAEIKLKEAKLHKEQLKTYSPFNGRVINVPVQENAMITKGQVLIWGEKDLGLVPEFVVFGYFDSKKDQRIKKGMIAQIKLNSVDYKKYGSLLAKVDKVWEFPMSSEELNKVIGNKQIVNYLNKSGADAPVQVVFRPIINKNNPSGYSWTSDNGPPSKIIPGSFGTIKVVVEAKRPIEFVFPIFRTIRDSLNLTRIENRKINMDAAD